MVFLPGVSGAVRAGVVMRVAEANRQHGSRQHYCHPREKKGYSTAVEFHALSVISGSHAAYRRTHVRFAYILVQPAGRYLD